MINPSEENSLAYRQTSPSYELALTRNVIDYSTVIEQVRTRDAGAVVAFLGTVREFTLEKQTLSLEYEAFPEMALSELRQIVESAFREWPLKRVCVVHRLGPLELGDIAIAMAVASPHRQAAFEAAAEMMTRIKQSVPIWKKEYWADGGSDWIHPGAG
ncbi:MAG: molybdenum cofactor biosynthesis protein MoaE [Planctomycetaceae bacterium]